MSVLTALYSPNSRLSTRAKRIWYLGCVVLYAIGLLHWVLFFELGSLKFNVHDWELTLHYLLGLDQSIVTGQLPLHVIPITPWHQTERFLANPDLPLSPQVLLLALLEPGEFVVVDTLILFSVGFLGLYLLAKRFDLSLFGFGLLLVLFSFNGHITAHLGVGHIVWLGYFLTPFVILLVLKGIHPGPDKRWPALVALLMFVFILQGSFHFAIWSVLFLILLAIYEPSLRLPVLGATLLTVALGAVRFIPAIVEFSAGDWGFIGGFQAVGDIPLGMASLLTPVEAANEHYGPPEWWEVDYFLGFLGITFLLSFGIAYWIRNSSSIEGRLAQTLTPAVIVMTFLSLDLIFRVIANLPIPFLGAERVSSRFFVYPFLLLILFSVIALQRWLEKEDRGRGTKLFLIAAFLALGLDLLQHSRVWRPSAAQLGFEVFNPNLVVTIQNRLDPEYSNSLVAGAVITAISFIYVLWRIFSSRNLADDAMATDGSEDSKQA